MILDRAAQEAKLAACREAEKAAVGGGALGRAELRARSALGYVSVRALTGHVGSSQSGLGSSQPLGVCIVDEAAFYADVGAARHPIAREPA